GAYELAPRSTELPAGREEFAQCQRDMGRRRPRARGTYEAMASERRPGWAGARVGVVAALIAALVAAACESPTGSASTTSNPAGSGDTASAQDSQTISVVKTVSPSVVLTQTSDGLGSGEIYDTKGNIVTNAHVVGTATKFVVTTSAGKRLEGTLVGSFP